MPIMRTAKRLGSAIGGSLVLGGATYAQWQASNPPVVLPTAWSSVPDWLATSPNPWMTATALLSALGAVGAIQQLFFAPKTATPEQVAEQGVLTRTKVDETAASTIAAIKADKLAQTLEAIRTNSLTSEQLAELRQSLAQTAADAGNTSADLAGTFVDTVATLATADDPGLRAAAASEVAGDAGSAFRQLMALGEAGASDAAARFRDAGALAAPFDVAQAIAAYARAADIAPDDCWTWINLARLHQSTGDLVSARRAAERGRQVATDERDGMAVDNKLGDIARAEGDLPAARAAFQAGLTIAERLAARDPGNSEWQRDLS
ncbi:MAG: hypothetical protein ACOYO0_07565, partial [Sandarakinorhabdus sp.]